MDPAGIIADLRLKLVAIESKAVEVAVARQQAEEIARTVDTLPPNDSLSKQQRAEFLFLKGKALALLDTYDRRAEDALGKSVKLNPAQIEGWNELGEVFYQKKDYLQSKRCFESALQICGPNKISLRKLSMVSRFLGNPEERSQNVRESVKLAKEALKLDINDGESWCTSYTDILGNAHLTNFFVNEPSPTELNSALKSYVQAETYLTAPNPDLHYNRGTAYKFLESYTDALADFHRSHELDPSLGGLSECDWITNLLTSISTMMTSKVSFTQCKLKPKKISTLARQLPTTLNDHPFSREYAFRVVTELKDFGNQGSIVACRILQKLTTDASESPARFVALDSASTFFVVSFYNTSPSAHAELVQFATVFVRDPFLIKVRAVLGDKVPSSQLVEYLCVRVGDPNMVLVGNKEMEGQAVPSVIVNKPV